MFKNTKIDLLNFRFLHSAEYGDAFLEVGLDSNTQKYRRLSYLKILEEADKLFQEDVCKYFLSSGIGNLLITRQ